MLWLTFFFSKPAGKLPSICFDWRCSSHLAGVVRCAKFNYHFDCITRLDHSELTFEITLSIESAKTLTSIKLQGEYQMVVTWQNGLALTFIYHDRGIILCH